jgi:hypothetical protein
MDTDKLVKAWIAMHHAEPKSQGYNESFWAFSALSDMCETSPDRCWEIIGQIRKADGSDKILANLAAGPLEELLVHHGKVLIDAVENLARDDEQFRKLLGALWQNSIAEDVWVRIKRVAGPSF